MTIKICDLPAPKINGVELPVYLISQDLLLFKMASEFASLGVNLWECHYYPDFLDVAVILCGFHYVPEEVEDLYTDLLGKHAESVTRDKRTAIKAARAIYNELRAHLPAQVNTKAHLN